MENRINFFAQPNNYLQQFYVAQVNLGYLIREERLRKRLQKSRKHEYLREQ